MNNDSFYAIHSLYNVGNVYCRYYAVIAFTKVISFYLNCDQYKFNISYSIVKILGTGCKMLLTPARVEIDKHKI